MESIAREAQISRKVASFLNCLAKLPETSFASPKVLQAVMEEPLQDIDGLKNLFWRHLSSYEIRGRRPDEDAALFKMSCEVRHGPNRCRAAQNLQSFFDRTNIKVKDVQDHPYNGRIF
eukprot:4153253-Karenia_brevis.AAC.1